MGPLVLVKTKNNKQENKQPSGKKQQKITVREVIFIVVSDFANWIWPTSEMRRNLNIKSYVNIKTTNVRPWYDVRYRQVYCAFHTLARNSKFKLPQLMLSQTRHQRILSFSYCPRTIYKDALGTNLNFSQHQIGSN